MMQTLANIGVDSGQMMMIRNKDVHLWKPSNTGDVLGIYFWGRDHQNVRQKLHQLGETFPSPEIDYIKCTKEKAEQLEHILQRCRNAGDMVVWTLIKNNPYDRLFIERENIRIPIQIDRSEVAYITGTYYGDGYYPVFKNEDEIYVSFLEENDWGNFNRTVIGFFHAEEGEEVTFIDPCYLDEEADLSLGCTVSIDPSVYDVFRYENHNGCLGIGIKKRN